MPNVPFRKLALACLIASNLPMAVATSAALLAGMANAQSAPASAPLDEQYRQGLYQRETGQPYSAIDTLDAILAANPSLNRVRLELAVAYYRTLNFAKAKEQAQRVLDDPKTPEAVKLSVLSFLKTLELEERIATNNAHKIEPSVSTGLFYDSNVNAGPDTSILGNGLVLNDGSLAHPDWGYLAQAALTHNWISASPTRFGESTGRLGWTTQLSGYHKGYKRYNEYDLGVLSLATGPTLNLGSLGRANINLQADKITLGSENLGSFYSISPSTSVRLTPGGELSIDGQWTYRQFDRPIDDGRQSPVQSVGLSYGHLFLQGSLSVQAGIKQFREFAAQERFTNKGDEFFVGGRYRAWPGGDVFARTALRLSDFDGLEPTFSTSRSELEQRLELGVSHQFQGEWLNKWQGAATFARVRNKANISLYSYQRDTLFFTIGRNF